MAIVLKDRVKETTITTGTGTITLTGAVAGYQSFAAIGSGSQTYYTIVDNENDTWEVGIGTYTSGGSRTLTRTTILSSSNSGSAVNFAAGTKDVFVTYPAEKAIYEEANGNVLIDGGPITVLGNNVTSYTTFDAALGEMYANIDSFAQFYAQNLNDGSDASADFVAYNDLGDGTNNFVDMGINSSNYSSATYPIFTPASAYLFNDGGEMFVGSATDDLVLFAGGTDTNDEAVRIDKTTKVVTTTAGMVLGGGLTGVGGSFTDPVTTTTSMASPSSTQLVTRAYVDSATSTAFVVHPAVRLATTTALSANTYNNGAAGVGATLTANANGALSIDGVTVATNDRVLIKNESTQANNGAYTVTQTGSAGTPYILTRVTDFDTVGAGEVANNAYFYVTAGTTNTGSSWILAQTAAITIGTTALPFTLFAAAQVYTGGTNIDITGTVISLTGTVAATNGGTGTNTVTTGDLLYGSGTNTWSKLAAGAAYKPLVMNASGTNVEWNAVALNQSAAVSGALGTTNGGTGLNTYTLGDIVYSSASDTLAKLAGNTTTTKKFLVQTGTGSVSAAPDWGTIDGSDVSGNISGQAGSVANALTLGTYLTGTSYNGGTAVTATVDATSANTANKVVARDGSGNFSAGTITATLNGAATSATTATNVAGGAANQIVYNTGSGATAFVTAPSSSSTYLFWNGSAFAWGTVASSITGTANQITASASSGAITLSTPQSIATTSSVQFGSFGVGTAASGTTGEIRATNNITAYFSSDIKFKENVAPITGATAIVKYIGADYFDWTDAYIAEHGGEDGYFVQKHDFGVIAQKVQAVFPKAVRTRPDGSLAVDYEKLGVLAFAALNEQEERIARLEALVAKLTKE